MSDLGAGRPAAPTVPSPRPHVGRRVATTHRNDPPVATLSESLIAMALLWAIPVVAFVLVLLSGAHV